MTNEPHTKKIHIYLFAGLLSVLVTVYIGSYWLIQILNQLEHSPGENVQTLLQEYTALDQTERDLQSQILDWTEVLIWSNQPAVFQLYRQDFANDYQKVQEDIKNVIALSHALSINQNQFINLLIEHRNAQKAYETALTLIQPNDPQSFRKANDAVKGIDVYIKSYLRNNDQQVMKKIRTRIASLSELEYAKKQQSKFVIIGILGIFLPFGSIISFFLASRTLAKVAANNERSHTILRSIGDGVVVTNKEGHIESLNLVAEKLLGWSNDDAQGKPLNQVFLRYHSETRLPLPGILDPTHSDYPMTGVAGNTLLITHQGREFPIVESISPLKTANDAIIGMVWIFHDISERHAAQQALEQQRKVAEADLYKRENQTRRLSHLTDSISHALDQEDIDALALDSLLEIIGCNRCSILLFDQSNTLRFQAWRGLSDHFRQHYKGLTTWSPMYVDAHPILVSDLRAVHIDATQADLFQQEGIRSVAIVPLEYQNRLMGKVLVVFDSVHRFRDEEVKLMQTITRLVGYAVGQKKSEIRIKEQERRLEMAIHSSGDCMWEWHMHHGISIVSENKVAMFGYSDEELGADLDQWLALVHPDDQVRLQDEFVHSLSASERFIHSEYRLLHKDGHWIWILSRGKVVELTSEGQFIRMIGTHSNITTRKLSEETIRVQAFYDALTNLPNRRMFRDHLEQEVAKSERTQNPVALLLIDLDKFKEVNDTLGHDIGDLLLKDVSGRIQACIQAQDTVFRLGGDEFVVLVTERHDPALFSYLAASINTSLIEPFQIGEDRIFISASIGITVYPKDSQDGNLLLKYADHALYEAKSQGKNGYCYFHTSMQTQAEKKVRIVHDLHLALDRQEFFVVYQPIITLADGTIHKAEALIRWQHPSYGLINPADFIPIAEDCGIITAIGDWLFYHVAAQIQNWRSRIDPRLQISINVSPAQFRQAIIFESWVTHLNDLNLSGQSLVVEITESLLLDAHQQVSRQLLSFRDAGIRVSLDDFGTGYSSLSYLKKFDIDYLKIDQSFVRNMTRDSHDLALCEAIITMAHKLDLKVIAEGVETEEQRILLTQAGCDYGQGFLFSKPLSTQDFEQLIRGR